MRSMKIKMKVVVAVAFVAFIMGAGWTLWPLLGLRASAEVAVSKPKAQLVREYTLEVVSKDINYGNGGIWHAWTFNGTVPGPTMRVKVGELLRVRVINRLNLIHSFHTHLTNYPFEMDGTQANVITGKGTGGMIPPGGEYTYEFQPTTPGIYYYHCHSADGGFMISQHILQGLYGAIIVEAPDEPPCGRRSCSWLKLATPGRATPPFSS